MGRPRRGPAGIASAQRAGDRVASRIDGRTTTHGHDAGTTTLELKINFLKPVWNARLRAEARIVKRGKTVGLVECDVVDENGSLVARASSTCLTLSGRKADGR